MISIKHDRNVLLESHLGALSHRFFLCGCFSASLSIVCFDAETVDGKERGNAFLARFLVYYWCQRCARPRICTMELCQSAVQKGRAAVDSKVVRGIVAPKGLLFSFLALLVVKNLRSHALWFGGERCVEHILRVAWCGRWPFGRKIGEEVHTVSCSREVRCNDVRGSDEADKSCACTGNVCCSRHESAIHF